MLLCKLQKFGGTHHRAIFAHDFAAKAAFLQSGETTEIDRSFRVACSHQHASIACLKREHVTWATKIHRFGIIVNSSTGSDATLHSRNTCRSGTMIDTNGESSEVIIAIVGTHLGQSEFFADLAAHWHTNQALCLGCHKVDVLGGGKLCCTNEVALILAIGVIQCQYAFACLEGGDGLFYGVELIHSMYFLGCYVV